MNINEPAGSFDLTPDTKVLIALTRTAMQPLDALCELIDNSIDSFQIAILKGKPIEHPLILIKLPRPKELNQGEGAISICDNGPGLTQDMAEKAIKAGYTGNNPYDSLGLFGMGFNISTGKLGRQTLFLTVCEEEPEGIKVIIDLEKIRQSGSYKIPFEKVQKSEDFNHGTIITIWDWWPEGDPNSGFVKKLVQYGMPVIRREIGRRYATILRDRSIRIIINDEECTPFEHCVWADSRYVERRDHGKIPAVFRFNQVIGSQLRCAACTALIDPGRVSCPACGSANFRTIEERIKGWVGIQRFDDLSFFGIDLIRNGRAIRIAEKPAFFEFVDEFKNVIKDYPIDQQLGRIVGEVHLDHVPVDFSKQDFQRSSPEWLRAMSFLRGDSSLQPNQTNANQNTSPIFKLFQGYRRVRTPGKTDMYMGYWDIGKQKQERIQRDTEKQYYTKFLAKLPGYYDDSEWWKLVEAADSPPLPDLVECPSCSAQNTQSVDVCMVCGYVLIGKTCINPVCSQNIPHSATSCPYCGMSQIPEVLEPWSCMVCNSRNAADRDICMGCGQPKGTENTLSREYLINNSNKSDELSILGCSVILADGSYSQPIDVDTYITRHTITSNLQQELIPLIAFKGEKIEVFVDTSHPLFKLYYQRPEQLIASEVALYIYDTNRRLVNHQGKHTLANLQWTILNTRWGNVLEDSTERVKDDIRMFFQTLKNQLPMILGDLASEFFEEMKDSQKRVLVDNLLDLGKDIGKISEMKVSGEYLNYIDENTAVDIFSKIPSLFFDDRFWGIPYEDITQLPEDIVDQARVRIFSSYHNCLQDVASFLRNNAPGAITRQRARLSLEFLQQKVVI